MPVRSNYIGRRIRVRKKVNISEGVEMAILDLKKLIKFHPDKISREMLDDKPEMRIALMCLEPGQKLEPHKAPLRLLMYVVEGKGTFTVGDERIEADEKTCIPCDPMVPHGFSADKGERLVVMAIVTPVE
ncbi:MAG TPA: cupin domain-containing protein [Nitrospirae bacterium]|nr:cupin domain-containing protein [Nitrospirota bacterium]HDZ01506.1 cupin domain-containing protein [Nitrospirota bacterium]